jgi:formate C-acetyltransferase
MFLGMVDAVATPIRDDELIVGDVPYDGFLENRDVVPRHTTQAEEEVLRAGAIESFRRATGVPQVRDYGSEFGSAFGMGRNFGHIIADYQLPLRLGFGGIRKKIEQRLSVTSGGQGEGTRPERHFLEAAHLSVQAAMRYVRRYAEQAQHLAEEANCDDRRLELERIAGCCRHIAECPPRDFREALQLVWLTQLLLEIESGVSAFSFGRLDQYLHPFLKADLDSGALGWESAQELVDCFWVKANEQNDRCEDAGRAVTIGGMGRNGEDRVNNLTTMMLAAAGRLGLKQPKLNARIHPGSPPDYLRLCCGVATQNAGPQLYNDEQIIASLEHFGFPREEAVEYGIIGCYETGIPGKERPWPMSGCLNLGKCLELAINDGVCRISGKQIGPRTGKLRQFRSCAQVEKAYRQQVAHFVGFMVEKNALDECVDEALHPQPFLSSLMHGCIESGKDVSAGGARYTNVGIRCAGFSAVADALMALKALVFDRPAIAPRDLETALSRDLDSCESLRQMLVNRAPKYGNDIDSVDGIARQVGTHFCREVLKYENIRGGRFKPGLFSFTSFLPAGRNCGALPNGRKARQPFANGVSPMHAMDRNGPTAMLRSASKLDYTLSPNASTLDLRLPHLVAGDDGALARLCELTRTYFDMGGTQLQLTVVSSEELRQAKRLPREYGHLIVRVAGYSAYFVDLSEDVQDEIISRTEHAL